MSAQTRPAAAEPRHRRHLRLVTPTETAAADWRVALRGVLTFVILGAVTLSAALLVDTLR